MTKVGSRGAGRGKLPRGQTSTSKNSPASRSTPADTGQLTTVRPFGRLRLPPENAAGGAAPGVDARIAEGTRRSFGRLRLARESAAVNGQASLLAPQADAILPVDSVKTFVGPNGTYYDERWRWMEWRGRNRSWNWAAALTLVGWLAYRRLYWFAALGLGWLAVMVLMALNGAPLRLVAALHVATAIGLGLYGNTLYQQRFRQMAWRVARDHEDHATRLKALAEAGGVDRRAAWIIAVAGGGIASLLVWLEA